MTLRFTAMSILLSLPIAASAHTEHQAFPAWLAGCHVETKDDRWTEECWTAPRAGIMLGSGRNGRGETLGGWEVMRIERAADGALTFWGAPKGATPVPFRVTTVSKNEIIFANPKHDYPQQIRYWRDGAFLHAEISLTDGSKAMRWSYGGKKRTP